MAKRRTMDVLTLHLEHGGTLQFHSGRRSREAVRRSIAGETLTVLLQSRTQTNAIRYGVLAEVTKAELAEDAYEVPATGPTAVPMPSLTQELAR